MSDQEGDNTGAEMDPVECAVEKWVHHDDSGNITPVMEDYHRYILRKWIFIAVCIVAAFLAAGYSLKVGAYDIGYVDTYKTIWEHLTGNIRPGNDDYVIWDMKLPRTITAILAGAGLAAAGVVMQSILRNPLADPYTTGISSGASFGATLALGLGITFGSAGYAVITNAFLFALIPMGVIVTVSKMRGATPSTMIMAGIAIMYIFNALTTMIKLFVDPDKLAAIFEWSVGTLEGTNWNNVGIMFVVVAVGVVALQLLAKKLNVISAGDDSARAIGVDAEKLRLVSLMIVSLLAAGVVSFTGLIGFVGLVCPHIARLIIGSDTRYLMPASMAFGAALLLFADGIGRYVISPSTIQVGVITAIIGAPLFLYLIVRSKKEAA